MHTAHQYSPLLILAYLRDRFHQHGSGINNFCGSLAELIQPTGQVIINRVEKHNNNKE